MYSLKASLKALVNLTNIPCLELKKNDFNPKGNMKVKRELFLDESPSSGPSAHPVGEQPEPGRARTEPARLLCPPQTFPRDASSDGSVEVLAKLCGCCLVRVRSHSTSPDVSRDRIRPPTCASSSQGSKCICGCSISVL